MSKKDNKINDDISNLMAQGVNQSLATATALDLSRKSKKKKSEYTNNGQHFYELSPWKIEPNEGRVKSGRVGFSKKSKMRHGAY